MKKMAIWMALLLSVILFSSAYAGTWVNGYIRKDGTYVQGYYRSSPSIGSYSYNKVNPSSYYVRGYYRKDGTYVQGHRRSSPNSNRRDNYSTWGNINPYTLEKGYQNKSCGLYGVNC